MPSRFPPKVIIVTTVFVFLIVGIFLWQRIGGAGPRGLVGVATADGTIYFGQLVLADNKSVILRNVYTSAGYYTPPVEEGRPAEKPRLQVNKYGAGVGPEVGEGEDTLTLSRSRVLFISKDVGREMIEAIRTWAPPTPPPTPSPLPTPEVGEEGETPVPSPIVIPTPIPTIRSLPRVTPEVTPSP